MDERVRAYLESVTRECTDVLGEDLISVWMVGSLVTGDFDMRRSDIDVLVTCAKSISGESKQALGQRLPHAALPCPAHGIDLLIYVATELEALGRSPHFEFSISSGVDWEDEIGSGGPYPGGLIDLAIARQLGVSLFGPKPQDVVGPCPEDWLLEELAGGIRWHTTRVHDPLHDPTGSNAVLNGCRALHFLSHRAFVSKLAGALWFLGRQASPVVADALSEREAGLSTHRLDEALVLEFLDLVIRELGAGAV